VGVLGPCKSVMAHTQLAVSDHDIVPEHCYDEFLAGVSRLCLLLPKNLLDLLNWQTNLIY